MPIAFGIAELNDYQHITIDQINNIYTIDIPSGLLMPWGASGEVNVYKEFTRPINTTFTLTADLSDISGEVYLFRKVFNTNGDFIILPQAFIQQPAVLGQNTFVVSSTENITDNNKEQIGIMVISGGKVVINSVKLEVSVI